MLCIHRYTHTQFIHHRPIHVYTDDILFFFPFVITTNRSCFCTLTRRLETPCSSRDIPYRACISPSLSRGCHDPLVPPTSTTKHIYANGCMPQTRWLTSPRISTGFALWFVVTTDFCRVPFPLPRRSTYPQPGRTSSLSFHSSWLAVSRLFTVKLRSPPARQERETPSLSL